MATLLETHRGQVYTLDSFSYAKGNRETSIRPTRAVKSYALAPDTTNDIDFRKVTIV